MPPSKAQTQRARRRLVWLAYVCLGAASLYIIRQSATVNRATHQPASSGGGHAPDSGVPLLWGNPCNFSLPSSGGAERLLVVVIASGGKPVYPAFRSFWRMTASRVAAQGIHVYLVGGNPQITGPQAGNGTLIFPGVENRIPGVLEQTVNGIRYIFDHQLPGSRAKFVVRTNLSSFWNFYGLLAWLAGKPERNFAAAVIAPGPPQYPSGAGYVLSRDVWLMVVKHRDELDYTVIDDKAVGILIAARGVRITPMPRNDFARFNISRIPKRFSCDDLHWRVKSDGNNQVQDTAIYASLFMYFYGPPSSLAPSLQLPGS